MDDPYELLPEDVEYLNAHHLGSWEKVVEGGAKFGLIVRRFSLPEGYVERAVTLLLLVPSGYPGVPLDMFYLHPPIQRQDGAVIGALAEETHFGIAWQRWSRHYEWVPGEDNIATHLEYVNNELRGEAAQ